MLIAVILKPLLCCGFLAAGRETALRGAGLRTPLERTGLAGRFFVAECLFMLKL